MVHETGRAERHLRQFRALHDAGRVAKIRRDARFFDAPFGWGREGAGNVGDGGYVG